MLLNVLFYGFAVLAVLGAAWVGLTSRVLHAALALLLTLLSVAALFVLYGADVAAATQLMAYVGGVLVLTLFGIMLSKASAVGPTTSTGNRVSGWVLGGLVFLGLATALWQADFGHQSWQQTVTPVVAPEGGVVEAGTALLTSAVLPVEIVSILLLIALIVAATIATGDSLSD
jgi:NADH-quinone oxidoreductase subunit J